MAMSGGSSRLVYTGYGGGNSNFPIKVYVYYKTTENTDTNTSRIYCGMYVTTPSGWNIGPWGDINGSYVGTDKLTFDGSIPNFSGSRWLAEDKTFDVEHSSDGSGSATIYWKWGVNSPWGRIQNISGSFTISLPSIPRASQPSCITWPNTTDDVGNIGDTIVIHMNRASSKFTHYVYCKWHDKTVEIDRGVDNNCFWKIPIDFANDIPSSTSSCGTIYVDTWDGSTFIGTKSVNFTAHVPDYDLYEVPATIWSHNENSVLSKWSILVKGLSRLGWSLEPQPSQYGNYITNYYLCLIPDRDNFYKDNSICDLTNTTDTSGHTDYLTYTPGTYRVKMTAKDSREKWSNYVLPDPDDSTKPLKITIYDYAPPKIQNAYAFRCDSSGITMDNGTYLSIGCSGVVGASIGGRNTVSVSYQWRLVGDEYSAKESIPDNPISEFPVTNAYEVRFTVRDAIGSETPRVISIPLGKTDFHLTPYGAGFGIYHDSNKPNTLQSNWDLEIKGNIIADFIVEQGTSGIWTYRKWSSGVAECWCETLVRVTTTLDENYNRAYGPTEYILFPDNFFIIPSTPCVTWGHYNNAYLRTNINEIGQSSINFYAISDWAIDLNVTFWIRAIGKWK